MKSTSSPFLITFVLSLLLSACSSHQTSLNTNDKIVSANSLGNGSAYTNTGAVANWPQENTAFCTQYLDRAAQQLDGFRKAYTDPTNVPRSHTNGETMFVPVWGWTSGFVAGSFWYIYEHTQDTSWLKTAKDWTYALEDMRFNRKTHDIGFIMSSSYGHGLRLTENKNYQPILVDAAKTLMERYNDELGLTFSWSWGRWEFPVIIDNMMNLELLFEASKATGDTTYYDAAVSHAIVTMKNHFRPDYSSYHLVDYDRDTGIPNSKETFQGIADDSSWARGQAWGAYGYTMTYRYTQDTRFLEHAKGIVNYLLNHKNMPQDLIPYFDYDAPDDLNVVNYRDSSAGALLASALLELSLYVDTQTSKRYRQAAMQMIKSLSSPDYLAKTGENGHFLLKQATGHYPEQSELNSAINYADYYYLEALHRCKNL